jgi:hypothetical protein
MTFITDPAGVTTVVRDIESFTEAEIAEAVEHVYPNRIERYEISERLGEFYPDEEEVPDTVFNALIDRISQVLAERGVTVNG